ncbi:hypothetical protein FB451DRAFT_1360364 [Mycena latifolia]|nr:hypothetical protein FB451DRAFT_1360364 [Mycena latifolia]
MLAQDVPFRGAAMDTNVFGSSAGISNIPKTESSIKAHGKPAVQQFILARGGAQTVVERHLPLTGVGQSQFAFVLESLPADKTGVCLSGASNVLAANSKSKTRVPCLFGGDESRCFDKARRSFNNRKQIDWIVDNEYNGIYGPEQTTSTVFNRVYGRFGACKPFRTQWEQTQRTV